MNHEVIYFASNSSVMQHCKDYLKSANFTIAEAPQSNVTHLLLPVPSFSTNDEIIGGGHIDDLLIQLPKDITIIGGNLTSAKLHNYHTIDLLQNSDYLCDNARITAHCALQVTLDQLSVTIDHCNVLIIGWGRIGKCLAQLLKALGTHVTVCARKANDRAMLRSLGYSTVDIPDVTFEKYRVIFNTVPSMLFPECPKEPLKIDLASQPGIGGSNVIWARGLPGKNAPESSGQLIAKTLISIIRKESI